MKVLAITQARMGSSRLPQKVLMKIKGQSLLQIHCERLGKSLEIEKLLVATTSDSEDYPIQLEAEKMGLAVFRGSKNNVLDRFYQAAMPFQPEWVVRLTADCPLIDPRLVDEVIRAALLQDLDYYSNTLNPGYPDGMDVEVFRFSALEKAWKEAILDSDKEHVTPYIYRNSSYFRQNQFKSGNHSSKENYGNVRLTVDEMSDLDVISKVIEKLGTDKDWQTYANYYLGQISISEINGHISRNEGFKK